MRQLFNSIYINMEIITDTVKEQADMQGLAARRFNNAVGGLAQFIVVLLLLAVLSTAVVPNHRCLRWKPSFVRKLRRVPSQVGDYFGHTLGSFILKGSLIG